MISVTIIFPAFRDLLNENSFLHQKSFNIDFNFKIDFNSKKCFPANFRNVYHLHIYIYIVHYNTFFFSRVIKFLVVFLSFGEHFDRLTTLQPNATFSIFIYTFNPITVAIEERLEVILSALLSWINVSLKGMVIILVNSFLLRFFNVLQILL